MMTKEELKSYKALKREQEQIEEKLWELEATIGDPKTAKMDGMPHGSPSGGSGLENVVARYIELKERYEAKRAEILAKQLAIETAIESLDPDERRMMRYRYIDGMKWEEVCVAMPYSWNQAHLIHRRVLAKLRDK